jgi:hypothetical protein
LVERGDVDEDAQVLRVRDDVIRVQQTVVKVAADVAVV